MVLAWFALALLVMLVGLLGAVLPLLPGLPLVLLGAYVYAIATGLGAGIGLGHLVLYTLIGGAAILLLAGRLAELEVALGLVASFVLSVVTTGALGGQA